MPAVDPRLLAILACPRCKGPLTELESERVLHCPDGDVSYLINPEGAPIMTVEDD